jgi:[FeFe] hydrogenase H-cluster maturation GTPase HydF
MAKGKDAKPHIGIFGRRNNGKSSLINSITGQEVAIVSEIAGTTTDPVKKSIEIPEVGPAVLIDTAGIDDSGELGKKRVEKTMHILTLIDAAILVVADNHFGDPEESVIDRFQQYDIPFFIVYNKSDLEPMNEQLSNEFSARGIKTIEYSCLFPKNSLLFQTLSDTVPETAYRSHSLIGDLIQPGDTVLLIAPQDTEAPEGRLILPQVQIIRDIIDNDAIAVMTKENEISSLLEKLSPRPALAITDSQVFIKANEAVPPDIRLTSFSIILARSKGDFDAYLKGTPFIEELRNGDRILIMESCTHHVTCDDIGRFKIPRWLTAYSGKNLGFDIVSGGHKPERSPEEYSLVIQCGGCMFTRRQLLNRLKPFINAGVPVTNYGMAIAWVNGIYKRAVGPFITTKSDS